MEIDYGMTFFWQSLGYKKIYNRICILKNSLKIAEPFKNTVEIGLLFFGT